MCFQSPLDYNCDSVSAHQIALHISSFWSSVFPEPQVLFIHWRLGSFYLVIYIFKSANKIPIKFFWPFIISLFSPLLDLLLLLTGDSFLELSEALTVSWNYALKMLHDEALRGWCSFLAFVSMICLVSIPCSRCLSCLAHTLPHP